MELKEPEWVQPKAEPVDVIGDAYADGGEAMKVHGGGRKARRRARDAKMMGEVDMAELD